MYVNNLCRSQEAGWLIASWDTPRLLNIREIPAVVICILSGLYTGAHSAKKCSWGVSKSFLVNIWVRYPGPITYKQLHELHIRQSCGKYRQQKGYWPWFLWRCSVPSWVSWGPCVCSHGIVRGGEAQRIPGPLCHDQYVGIWRIAERQGTVCFSV